MTGDFATVAWRLRLLGFNAVRVAFTFDALADSMANYSAFTACAVSDRPRRGRRKRLGGAGRGHAAAAGVEPHSAGAAARRRRRA